VREPVFQIGSDFVNGLNLRTAITGAGGNIIASSIKGTSGIVPKVKINYTEIGYMTNGSVSKDQAKNACELIFKDIADKVKKGMTVSLPIPGVGVFKSKGTLCAVQFN